MSLHHITKKALLSIAFVLGLGTVSIGAANAQKTVSIKGEKVNMREAPGLKSDVLWQLGSGYPLKVIQRKGDWLKVVDFENDRGWVSKRYTSTAQRYIVKVPRANLRSGPGTRHRVLGQATYGEVLRPLKQSKSWVLVKLEDARKGWIARRLLWGW